MKVLTGVFALIAIAAGVVATEPNQDAPPAVIDQELIPKASSSFDIGDIKPLLPDQAHAMQDVGYHFSNLWFAADIAIGTLQCSIWLKRDRI